MRPIILMVLACAVLVGCSSGKFKRYNGPEVTQILVDKSDRKMWLLHEKRVLKEYDVDLGFAPAGHKQFEGDGRTPEGIYRINRRNPNSRYHLSLGISYPNTKDVAFARARGKSPGGEIFIHGGPRILAERNKADWTAGCISVTDKEMETIYAMVNDGTLIYIKP